MMLFITSTDYLLGSAFNCFPEFAQAVLADMARAMFANQKNLEIARALVALALPATFQHRSD